MYGQYFRVDHLRAPMAWPCSSRDCSQSTPTILEPFQPRSTRRLPPARHARRTVSRGTRAYEHLLFSYKQVAYAKLMGTRP
jgi:hypothetical protein